MRFEPDIQFIKENAEDHIEQFTDRARVSKNEDPWRCLCAALNPDLTKNPDRKRIVAAFLKASFENADDLKAFWLASGHLFIFFQGPVRAVIKEYEIFLSSLHENGKRREYHFFWELNEFWGYFDEILANALAEKQTLKTSEPRSKKTDQFIVPEDLRRQRQARYKPLLLIVEDDRVTRHVLQAVMEKYCDIAVAWDAQQAQELYQAMLPNITFLDIKLPDGDGQELAELFCSHDPDSFVIMVSGDLSPDKVERCLKAGVKGTVKKPAQEAQLLKFIDQYNKAKQDRAVSS